MDNDIIPLPPPFNLITYFGIIAMKLFRHIFPKNETAVNCQSGVSTPQTFTNDQSSVSNPPTNTQNSTILQMSRIGYN